MKEIIITDTIMPMQKSFEIAKYAYIIGQNPLKQLLLVLIVILLFNLNCFL